MYNTQSIVSSGLSGLWWRLCVMRSGGSCLIAHVFHSLRWDKLCIFHTTQPIPDSFIKLPWMEHRNRKLSFYWSIFTTRSWLLFSKLLVLKINIHLPSIRSMLIYLDMKNEHKDKQCITSFYNTKYPRAYLFSDVNRKLFI